MITSTIFDLIETFEFDMTLGDDSWPTRVEIYQASDAPNRFRCRVWQLESYRIQSAFPKTGGASSHAPSDELILVEYSHYLRCDWDPSSFEASSPVEARRLVESALVAFLDHSSSDLPV